MSPKFLCQRNRYNDISTIYWISPRCFPPPYATDSGGLAVFNDWLTDSLTTEDPQYHHTSPYWLLEPLLASEENLCGRYPLLVSIEMDKHFKTGALVLLPKSQSNPTQNTATDTVSVTLPLFADMVVGRHQQQQVLGRLPDAGVVMQRSISNGVHTAPTYANWIYSDNSLLVTAKYKYCNQTTRRLCSYG